MKGLQRNFRLVLGRSSCSPYGVFNGGTLRAIAGNRPRFLSDVASDNIPVVPDDVSNTVTDSSSSSSSDHNDNSSSSGSSNDGEAKKLWKRR